jgi:hypothetical protein
MYQTTSSRLESRLRLFTGFLLWAVSASLTVLLLISLGENSLLEKALLGIVAIALEGTKILSWRAGGRARVLAIALICLSGVASLGASLQVVEKSKGVFLTTSLDEVRSSPSYIAKTEEIHSLDSEIATLLDRIKSLPADYTTASLNIIASLSSLRDRKAAILASLSSDEKTVGASYDGGSMIVLLARAVGFRPEIALLILLLVVAGTIEVGALLLSNPENGKVPPKNQPVEPLPEGETIESTTSEVGAPSYGPPIDVEEFLDAAKEGADLPFLNGRDRTAERLGISYADGKRLVAKLIEDGRVVVDGRRLRLAQIEEKDLAHSLS